MNPTDDKPLRPIRSFVLRQGRMTLGQSAALAECWPVYGLEPGQALNTKASFGRDAPLVLEIGFGNGESLAQMAVDNPERDFLGIEVHRPGVGHLLLKLRELGLHNVRVYCADAVDVLKNCIPAASLDGIQVFFPDPWHKKRHHKRRLVNAAFAALMAEKLKPEGILHLATDWEDYALQMLTVLENTPGMRNLAGAGNFSERPATRPQTKFETRGLGLGHRVWDLLWAKSG